MLLCIWSSLPPRFKTFNLNIRAAMSRRAIATLQVHSRLHLGCMNTGGVGTNPAVRNQHRERILINRQ